MKSALGPVRATVTAALVVVAVAAALAGGLAGRSEEHAPAAAVVPAAATSTAPATTVAAAPTTAAASTSDAAASSSPPQFADGDAARTAAEGVIAPYIQAQFAIAITDVACSQPPTGAEGEQFVCYGLKEGDLVIALRATIGAEQLITLDLIANQEPTTTAPPVTSAVESTVSG